MDLSVAQGRPTDPETDLAASGPATIAVAVATGVLLAIAAFGVYRVTHADRYLRSLRVAGGGLPGGPGGDPLPGRDDRRADRATGSSRTCCPVGRIDGIDARADPLPAAPRRAARPVRRGCSGLATDDQLLFTILAAIDVALCWWMIGRLRVSTAVRVGTTVFFAFGTAFWYTAQNTTTWYQAHIVAVGLTMLAVGLALGADRSRHVMWDARARDGDSDDARRSTVAGSRSGCCSVSRRPPA